MSFSGEARFFVAEITRGSSSLKQASLAYFKFWEFTRNLHFTMTLTCCVILALKDSTALFTAS
jgi:hypothetical protein